MIATSVSIDGKSRSPVGIVASAYITWVVLSFGGAVVGLLSGVAMAGLEGGYVGATIGVAIATAVCFADGSLMFCIVGGLFVGTAAAVAGLYLDLPAGVWSGALAGIGPGLLRWKQPRSGKTSVLRRALRALAWIVVGAAAGGAGFLVLDSFRGMEL